MTVSATVCYLFLSNYPDDFREYALSAKAATFSIFVCDLCSYVATLYTKVQSFSTFILLYYQIFMIYILIYVNEK